MPGSAGFQVQIDGSPLPPGVAALLVGAHVDESLRLPDLFVLRFRDPDHTVVADSHAKIGSAVAISVMTDDSQSPEKLVEGEITALEGEFDSTGTFTVLRGYDKAHRLFRGRHTETYMQSSASDVATKVAQRAGLKIGTVDNTTTVHDHLFQAGVTDWEFLDGLAHQNGFEIAVRDGSFNFGKAVTAQQAPSSGGGPAGNPLVLRGGTDLLRFRTVITSAEQVGQVEVRGWNMAEKKALVGNANAGTKYVQLPDASPSAMSSAFGSPTYLSTRDAYGSQSEVDAAAGALAEEISASFAEIEAVARGNPKLRANTAISVENLGKPFDGKYVVTTARHRYDPTTGYTTAIAVTGRQDRSLLGLAGGQSAGTRYGGAVLAQVTDAKDPQGLGRVKVSYPWLSDDHASDWAPTVQAGAGKDRGALILPEVGDEVLVVFDHGDVNHPFVLGGLYNGTDKPKSGPVDPIDSSSGAVNRRSLVSRNGHRIDLLDQDGKTEGITLESSDSKLQIVMDSVGTKITVHSDGTVTVEGKQGVTIDASSSKLALKAGQIEMTATSGVKIDGGSGSVNVQAGGDLSLKGTNATVEGSANTNVKGGALCQLQAALIKIN